MSYYLVRLKGRVSLGMSVDFSRHALEKARKRHVTMSDVYDALDAPDELFEDVEHGTFVAVKKVYDKFVIVAYRKEDGVVKVITVYYTVKFDRLLRAKMVRDAWKKIK
jgi:hypothetical protein